MLCVTYGGLRPTDSVLDLGCGIGRTALAMSGFLELPGRYTGIDIVRFAIDWCRANISSVYSNFSFVHADVRNGTYNRGGSVAAGEFSFPFASQSFHFCLATSLFTHLLPDATARYLTEIGRVLQQEGRFISTWFLLDDETRPYVEAGRSENAFPFAFASHAQVREHAPESAVAYYGEQMNALFAAGGLEIEAIHHGGWSGLPNSIDSGQDLIVARRASSS